MNISEREKPWSAFCRSAIQNTNLSLEAKGLLALIESFPENWILRITDLRKRCKIGEDKMRRIVKELVDEGHLFMHEKRGENGQILDRHYKFNSEGNHSKNPDTGKPSLGLTQPGRPPTLREEHIRTYKKEEDNKRKEEERRVQRRDKREEMDASVPTPSKPMRVRENILLTEKQITSLKKAYGVEGYEKMLDRLSDYKLASGKIYTSDYLAIKRWVVNWLKSQRSEAVASEALIEDAWEWLRARRRAMELVGARGDPQIKDGKLVDDILRRSISLLAPDWKEKVMKWYSPE